MLHRLKGRLHLLRLGLRFRWAYLLGAAGALYGAVTAITAPGQGVALVVASLFAGLGVVVLARDTVALSRETRVLYQVEVDPGALKALRLTDTYADFTFEDFRGARGIYSPALNGLLPAAEIPVRHAGGRYRLPEGPRQYQPFLLREAFRAGPVLFNEPKVRMASDLTPSSIRARQPVRVERTDYFASICTNELALRQIRSPEAELPRLTGLELIASNGQVLDLDQSLASNHIGIATLAITVDGQLIVTVQARSSAQSANLLAPSGSGSADVEDLERAAGSFTGFLTAAMERELAEECGLDRAGTPMRTVLIGYARLLMRGAKPEFFGLTWLGQHSRSLAIPSKESVFIADILGTRVSRSDVADFKRCLSDYRAANETSFSLPLHLHLRFLEDFVDVHEDLFLGLLTGHTATS